MRGYYKLVDCWRKNASLDSIFKDNGLWSVQGETMRAAARRIVEIRDRLKSVNPGSQSV